MCYLVSHHNELPAQLDPRRSGGALEGSEGLLGRLDLSIQANRPLIHTSNLFFGIRAAGSISAYGNKSVRGAQKVQPPHSWVRRWPTGRGFRPTNRSAQRQSSTAQTQMQLKLSFREFQLPCRSEFPVKFKPNKM